MEYLPLPLEPHIDVEEFDPAIFDEMPIVHRRKRKSKSAKPKPEYLDCVCAFDIEATNIHEIKQAVMYIWQFQIEDKVTVFGRTWESFFQMLRDIDRRMKDNVKLCIYIHNLSYEFVFFESWYPFQIDEVFAMKRRKVARCDMYNHIEFRCSYIHSNMSLREYTRKMNVKHKKLDDYDYDIPLYPWSSLTVEQLRYCQNDVLGLCEAIRKEMEQENDNLITIPLTSTGYVRRDCKKAMHSINYHYAQPFFRPSPCTGLCTGHSVGVIRMETGITVQTRTIILYCAVYIVTTEAAVIPMLYATAFFRLHHSKKCAACQRTIFLYCFPVVVRC